MGRTVYEAVVVANRLNQENRIDYNDYSAIMDGLEEIETLRERDQMLEDLWREFADVPMDPDTERMEEQFLDFPAGTSREEIWHWFDVRHSKGVAYLLYGDGIDRTDQFSKMVFLKQLCPECESASCGFNHGGECRFPLVHERKPRINDVDGCIDYDYSEGDV